MSQEVGPNRETKWMRRISKQGPWDPVKDPMPLTGAPALPMPVRVSDREALVPFFAHLRSDGSHEPDSVQTSIASNRRSIGVEPNYGTEFIEFEKGVLYSDGRIDLCKMVTGPPNIAELMDALKSNLFAKHFLLGNNIIGPVGARAISDFTKSFPDRFETWYLAGNAIDTEAFRILVDSMIESPVITNIWMKRNPLQEAAADDVFRLIRNTPKLRTLDLDQTELGDAGITKLFTALATYDHPVALRHIYLNAVGVSEKGCTAIAQYLASKNCDLQSLYLSNNPIGDRGAAALAVGMSSCKSLQRLSLQSCGLQDITTLLDALSGHSKLRMLDLGQSYATEDLGSRYNWLTDTNVPSLIRLIKSTLDLEYLNLGYIPITEGAFNTILAAVLTSGLTSFTAKLLSTKSQEAQSVQLGQDRARLSAAVRVLLQQNVKLQYGVEYGEFQKKFKRFILSPMDVRLIDSVYRNRDAAAARRGEKRLEKWWGEGDETLKQVMEGMFE